ncbi:MAG: hypothetical protein AB8B71_16065 [Paracoccaceae bacterium]
MAPSSVAPPLPAAPYEVSEDSVDAPDPSNGFAKVSGFTELRWNTRLNSDPFQKRETISEFRAHLEVEGATIPFRFAADLLFDDIDEDSEGEGVFDVREASLLLRPADNIDVRLGRQILTWGTGDLMFINDVFPKDYVSFFAGRSDNYLKAPADAARVGIFTDLVNVDFVLMSAQSVDRSIDGERLSFTEPSNGLARGRNNVFESDAPSGVEYALRAYRTFGSYEVAGYAYYGHWKSPGGVNAATGRGVYPELSVYGASVRGPLAGGIASAEFGIYDSREDHNGTNPLINNGEKRILLGFEREIASETTLGIQYYLARMDNHAAYVASAPAGSVIQDENRDLVSVRLTKFALRQTLTASAIAFYSPTQKDSYLRMDVSYRPTDSLTLNANLGHFIGDAHTPFGQFETGSNFGIGVRYSF